MKGKKWKVLYGLFLAIVSCLLYNTLFTLKNANAAVVDLSGFEVLWSGLSRVKTCLSNCPNNNFSSFEWSYINKNTNYWGFVSEATREFKKGDIVEFDVEFIGTVNDSPEATDYLIKVSAGSNNNFTILNIESNYDSSYSRDFNALPYSTTGGSAYNFNSKGSLYKHLRVTQVAKNDGTFPFQFSVNGSTVSQIYVYPDSIGNFLQNNGVMIRIVSFTHYRKDNSAAEMNQKDNEDRNNLENQSQQTDSDANSAEQQMQSGTSSLISVVTSFSNAMIGVRRTNCKLPRMTAYDFDLGELDLCTYSPPAWIQTITSAVVSLIVVRLAYKIFKRIMGIAKGISK